MANALQKAFLDVDTAMRIHFKPSLNPNERSGCTAIAVVITPTHIITANAGDSRALLSRAGANVVRILWASSRCVFS
jgi:serine/threonine protein phosphatase PrpC